MTPTPPLGARGERPILLPCSSGVARSLERAVPGVKASGSAVACAWDAAPVAAGLLGLEGVTPPLSEAPTLLGLEEYQQLKLASRLRPYQREMVAFLARRAMAVNADPMRCLAGSTVLTVNRGGKAFQINMARLARGLAGELGWDLSIPTRTQSMDESGSIRLNLITAIHSPGRKRVLLLTLADGKHLEATADHKIATPVGMKPLGQLRAGETVLVAQWPTKQEKPRAKNSSRYLQGFWSHPFAEKFEQPRKDRPVERVARCKKHRLAAEAKLNGLAFEEYIARVRADELDGLQFLDPAEFHVHHRDGDHTNDAPENLEVLSQADHARLHGLEGHWRAVSGRAVPVAVKSITDCGEAETFDLTMFNPWNNYVANEIIVSNSGKTPTTLSACIAVGASKVLIVCPAVARLVWATEIAKWARTEALLLCGRGADEARWFCAECNGTGSVAGVRCAACKARNGSSYGTRLVSGPEAAAAAVESARWLVVNYDLLVPQAAHDAAGKKLAIEHLPGWADLLGGLRGLTVIADEAHMLRGRGDQKRKGDSRRERLVQAAKGASRFWALTGTPLVGRVADLWGLLDTVTDGLFGRPFFDFDVRYCLPSGVSIWMHDLTHKAVESIRVGDVVWGWTEPARGKHRKLTRATVLDIFTRKAEVVEATLASGRKVRSTRDHLWANPVSKTVPYRVLSVGAASKRKGREGAKPRASVLARVVDPEWPIGSTDVDDYLRGYAHGLADGDGHVGMRWHLRPARNGTRAELVKRAQVRLDRANGEALERFMRALDRSGVRYSFADHSKFPCVTASGSAALAFFYQPREGSDDYWRGWLAGMYDAEGWGATFAQHRAVNPETHANLQDALRRFDFDIAVDDETVRIRGSGDGCKGSRTREFVRFWLLTQPAITRKMEPLLDSALYWEADKVVSIRSLGIQDVYDFKTTTGNFVADGYGSHNCEGHKGQYGWVAQGATNVEELKARLSVLMWKRTRAELNQFMPPKTRQIVTLDLPADGMPRKSPGDTSKGVAAALRRTAKIKAPAVIEAVTAEMAEGAKVLVFAYLKKNADDLAKAIGAACDKHPLKSRRCGVWSVSGATPTDVRFRNAEAFRAHEGPAAFVATLDSVQVALSLKGAQSVHFADLHYEPAALLQAEDRPYEPGTKGVTVLYYVVANSIDQHVVDLMLPKMETLENVAKDAQAGEFAGAFRPVEETDLAEAIWARHTEAGEVESYDD